VVRVEIADRFGSYARYFVYDESGKELRQVHRDVSAEVTLAKRQKTSLRKVLEKVEA
jgi:hypothetical protein